MRITEIRNLDLFKYSLVILGGSIVFLLFPFVFFLFHYQQSSKNTLQNIFYAFACFGFGILLLNIFLLFWVLNSQVKSNNRQHIQQFESNFFQLLNYLRQSGDKLDARSIEAIHFSIQNFIRETQDDMEPGITVQKLMATLRRSVSETYDAKTPEQYLRQLNTMLVYIFSSDHPLIDEQKYLHILEANLH